LLTAKIRLFNGLVNISIGYDFVSFSIPSPFFLILVAEKIL